MDKLVNPRDWKNMDGDSEIEKRINSYLTCQFIVFDDVPADECLDEAKYILELIKQYGQNQ